MVFTCHWLLSVFMGFDHFQMLFHFHLAYQTYHANCTCLYQKWLFVSSGRKTEERKKKRWNIFDLECRVCFISSPPLHLLFLFSAPLTPYMLSNHHLGKPDKLGSRHQHLGADVKSFLETVATFAWPGAAIWARTPVQGAGLALFQSTVSPFFNLSISSAETRRPRRRQGEEIFLWCIYIKDLVACVLLQVSQIIFPLASTEFKPRNN